MPDQDFASELPSLKGKTPFERALEIVKFYPSWIDWNKPNEVVEKPLCFVLAFLESPLGDDVPELKDFLLKFFSKITDDTYPYIEFCQSYVRERKSIMRARTEFIIKPLLEKQDIREGQERYYHSEHVLCLVDFLLIHRPCCRLLQTASLIPAIAMGLPAIPVIAYAAERFADLINDPVEPGRADCTPVGNSWLHRLGIYLLHQCRTHSIPPDDSLIRLMSLVSPPPSASVKSGKATRYSDYLADPPMPCYLHEAPPNKAVGLALALELLGEFDPNRQGEHYRRLERAVAYYGNCLLNGKRPSIKGIQQASGLSWADADKVVDRPFFSRLVFEYQCRYLTVEPCPDCQALARRLDEDGMVLGPLMASSGSYW